MVFMSLHWNMKCSDLSSHSAIFLQTNTGIHESIMSVDCGIHGHFSTCVVADGETFDCPVCRMQGAQKEIFRVCDLVMDIDCHWRDEIRCVDIFNYNTVRYLIPERCGQLTNGRKFMIEFDGPDRFGPMQYMDRVTDFEDQVHKDYAKMAFIHEHGWHVLRISFKEFTTIEHWVHTFFTRCMQQENEKQVILCSNEVMYDTLQETSEYFLREDRKWTF